MATDLNPNRAGNSLDLAYVSGLNFVGAGPATLTVAQLGNTISLQVSGSVGDTPAGAAETAVFETLLAADAASVNDAQRLIARMLPSGSPFLPLAVYNSTSAVWYNASVQLSTVANKLRLTIVPPSGAWPALEALSIEGTQLHYMSVAQDGRDFVSA
jgi:hypothetical protein